ncbi:MAG: hypothetical protein ACI9SY_000242 [Candidatus Paceibacteria bacterium]|jgi:hypothetical protein
MLLLPSSIAILATVILTVALVVVYKEQKKGERLFLTRFRNWLDRLCEGLAKRVRQMCTVTTVSCVYIIHQLRAALALAIAPRPRKQKRQRDPLVFSKTDNHLSSMHDHKSDTALTPAQKKKLRNKKLEERL